ncbi:MAG TPA: SIMPL domain-containing protein [Rectinemataceae bacterium]
MRKPHPSGAVGAFCSLLIFALAVLLPANLPAQAAIPSPGAETSAPSTLSVSGEALIRVQPDLAAVTFGISVQAKTPSAARDAALSASDAVVKTLAASGLDKKDIRTGSFGLWPVYDDRPGKQQSLIGYRAEAEIEIRLANLALLSQVVEAATGAGANEVRNLVFKNADESRIRADVLASAAVNALVKAKAVAEALGMRLAKILKVEEGGGASLVPNQALYALKRADSGSTAEAFSPGSIEYRASIGIVYALE